MKMKLGKKFWVIPLILVTIIGSISVAGAMEKGDKGIKQAQPSEAPSAAAVKPQTGWVQLQIYQDIYSRSRWLYDLMTVTGKLDPAQASTPASVFEAAQAQGVLSRYSEEDITKPLNRLFAAQTTVAALGYKFRDAGRITDITLQQNDMSTMAYYGFFIKGSNDMVYPDAEITPDEYDSLMTEVYRYAALKGKTVLTFGDSIMHGTGNNDRGIGSMIAEKYGMTLYDYSVPGAAMGKRAGRGHIRDQLKPAFNDKRKPDIILINGGTNDMNHTAYGNLTDGFNVANISENDFTGGFEKTMYNLQRNWSDVPVIYIRVHNMDLGSDESERLYGLRGLAVARKWGAATVDLYTDTSLNTEDPEMCSRYTLRKQTGNYSFDSIHPNALGYAKYYLPLISEEVFNQLNEEQ